MIHDEVPPAPEASNESASADQLVTTDELDAVASSLDAVEAALGALDASEFDRAEQLVESLDSPSPVASAEEE